MFRTFHELQNSPFQFYFTFNRLLQYESFAPTVKHKPMFDTLVNYLKQQDLLALVQTKPMELSFLLSVRGHRWRLGKISHQLTGQQELAWLIGTW